MSDDLCQLEERAIELLLAGDVPALQVLRNQYRVAKVIDRTLTGAGFFTRFEIPITAPRIEQNRRRVLSDVVADIPGLDYGAGFALFVDDGAISMLEGFTYEEDWPGDVYNSKVHYAKIEGRDLQQVQNILENGL